MTASIAAVITAVAFDLDGTLLDHERAARDAVCDWVATRGWRAPEDVAAQWLRLEREVMRGWERDSTEMKPIDNSHRGKFENTQQAKRRPLTAPNQRHRHARLRPRGPTPPPSTPSEPPKTAQDPRIQALEGGLDHRRGSVNLQKAAVESLQNDAGTCAHRNAHR